MQERAREDRKQGRGSKGTPWSLCRAQSADSLVLTSISRMRESISGVLRSPAPTPPASGFAVLGYSSELLYPPRHVARARDICPWSLPTARVTCVCSKGSPGWSSGTPPLSGCRGPRLTPLLPGCQGACPSPQSPTRLPWTGMREPAFVFLRWRHGDQPVGAEGGRRPQATVPVAIGPRALPLS